MTLRRRCAVWRLPTPPPQLLTYITPNPLEGNEEAQEGKEEGEKEGKEEKEKTRARRQLQRQLNVVLIPPGL